MDLIDVDEIAMALADQTDYEHRWLVDPRSGEVVFWTSDTGIDGENPVDLDELDALLAELDALPGVRGYVTETFCEQARYFQPHNGIRIDAIRHRLVDLVDHPLYPVLLTALIEAADRVDSTTGQHMAYLKSWSRRLRSTRTSTKRPGRSGGCANSSAANRA